MKLLWGEMRSRSEDGAVAVEMAILVSWLVLAVLGVIGLGLLLWIWGTMQLGVDEGGRYAMVMFRNGTGPPSWSINGKCTGTTSINLLDDCTKKYTEKMMGTYGIGRIATVSANSYFCSVSSGCITPAAGTLPNTMVVTARYNFDFVIKAPLVAQVTVPLVGVPFKIP